MFPPLRASDFWSIKFPSWIPSLLTTFCFIFNIKTGDRWRRNSLETSAGAVLPASIQSHTVLLASSLCLRLSALKLAEICSVSALRSRCVITNKAHIASHCYTENPKGKLFSTSFLEEITIFIYAISLKIKE